MTADWYTTITLTGTQKQILSMLHLLQAYKIDTVEHSESFMGFYIDGGTRTYIEGSSDGELLDSFRSTKETTDADKEIHSVTVLSSGPWGRYGHIDDIWLFEKLARESLGGKFEINIEGGTCYTDERLKAIYDGRDEVKIHYEGTSFDTQDEAYEKYMAEILPFEEFLSIFGLDEEQVDECDYVDLVISAMDGESYDVFLDYAGLSEEELSEECFEEGTAMLKEKNIIEKAVFLDDADIWDVRNTTVNINPINPENKENGIHKQHS